MASVLQGKALAACKPSRADSGRSPPPVAEAAHPTQKLGVIRGETVGLERRLVGVVDVAEHLKALAVIDA